MKSKEFQGSIDLCQSPLWIDVNPPIHIELYSSLITFIDLLSDSRETNSLQMTLVHIDQV